MGIYKLTNQQVLTINVALSSRADMLRQIEESGKVKEREPGAFEREQEALESARQALRHPVLS